MVDFGTVRMSEDREESHLKRLESRLNQAKESGDSLMIKEAEAVYNYFKKEYSQ